MQKQTKQLLICLEGKSSYYILDSDIFKECP